MSRDPHPNSTAEQDKFSSTAVAAIHQRRLNACSSEGAILLSNKEKPVNDTKKKTMYMRNFGCCGYESCEELCNMFTCEVYVLFSSVLKLCVFPTYVIFLTFLLLLLCASKALLCACCIFVACSHNRCLQLYLCIVSFMLYKNINI